MAQLGVLVSQAINLRCNPYERLFERSSEILRTSTEQLAEKAANCRPIAKLGSEAGSQMSTNSNPRCTPLSRAVSGRIPFLTDFLSRPLGATNSIVQTQIIDPRGRANPYGSMVTVEMSRVTQRIKRL